MLEFRVTKYGPEYRDEFGAYTREEWTSVSDIGRAFGGAVLKREEYERVESAYIEAALEFLREAGVPELQVCSLENPFELEIPWTEGSRLDSSALRKAFRSVLREEYWCRFESQYGTFVHFGYDYYMFVGVPSACPSAILKAKEYGLYVEDIRSPYHPDDDNAG